jgi:hypothetical protein
MKTQSRSYVSDHASSSQVRARCSVNPQARVEHRPFQRQIVREPFVNYEQHKREISQRANIPYLAPLSKIDVDLRPLVICTPRLFDCGNIFGYQLIVRGSPEYY